MRILLYILDYTLNMDLIKSSKHFLKTPYKHIKPSQKHYKDYTILYLHFPYITTNLTITLILDYYLFL